MKYMGIMIAVPVFAVLIEALRRYGCRIFHLEAEPNPLTQTFVLILAALATILSMILLRMICGG